MYMYMCVCVCVCVCVRERERERERETECDSVVTSYAVDQRAVSSQLQHVVYIAVLCVTFLMSLLFSATPGVLLPPSVVQQPTALALCLLSGEIQPCHHAALLQNQCAPGQGP